MVLFCLEFYVEGLACGGWMMGRVVVSGMGYLDYLVFGSVCGLWCVWIGGVKDWFFRKWWGRGFWFV